MKSGHTKVVFLQLPVPQLNFRIKTLNIPLGPAWLKVSLRAQEGIEAELVPQDHSTYLSDMALLEYIAGMNPHWVGLSLYLWNLERSLYIAKKVKESIGAKVIVGGPEVSRDNHLVDQPWVDFLVMGEGEDVIKQIILGRISPEERWVKANECSFFGQTPSPYLYSILDPKIEEVMCLETQRGCPYRCWYCYYPKASKGMRIVSPELVEEALRWARLNHVKEVYLMDPSLEARPDLTELLQRIGDLNRDKVFILNSELRPDKINNEVASLMERANFKTVEVGLQSINQQSLKAIGRDTDVRRALKGIKELKSRGIETKVDIILGLPMDNLDRFKKTVEFLVENQLSYDAEMFLLSVLPGTRLRRVCSTWGIQYEKVPPYRVISSPWMSEADIRLAWDMAEDLLDTNFNPPPILELSYKVNGASPEVFWDGGYISKIIVKRHGELRWDEFFRRLTNPYQIVFTEGAYRQDLAERVLNVLTSSNPYTPLEMVIFEPPQDFSPHGLISALNMPPQYLDRELGFKLYPWERGCFVITLILQSLRRDVQGYLIRQVYWWRQRRLPSVKEWRSLDQWDGILIDGDLDPQMVLKWQERNKSHSQDMPELSFSDLGLQRRWMVLCHPQDYYEGPLF